MSLFHTSEKRRPRGDSSACSPPSRGGRVGFMAGMSGLVACLSLTVSLAHAQPSPSFSNKRAGSAASKNPSPTARKKACDAEPSTVTFGNKKEVGKQTLPSGQTAFRPATSAPRWQCDKPNVMTKPVWGRESIVCEFEFRNIGAQHLSVRAKAG